MLTRMTALIVAGLAIAAIAPAAEPAKKLNHDAMEKLGWKLSIQGWTFNSKTLFEVIDISQGLDLRYIEMFPGQKMSAENPVGVNENMPAEAIAQLKAKLKAANIKPVCFGVTGIPNNEEGARKLFKWAADLGIETINTEPNPSDKAHFDLLEKLADEYKVNVGLHNHPKPSPYWDPAVVLKATEGRSKRIGSCADTGHWYRSGLVPLDCIKKLEGRIVASHFKDLNANKQDVPYLTGECNVRAMLEELKRQGFKGVFSIEYERWDAEQMNSVTKCIQTFSDLAGELAK